MDLPRGINMVVVAPSRKFMDALIKVAQETANIVPTMRSVSVSADRAHYPAAASKVIINTAAEYMHEKLGRHYVVLALEVPDRVAAAHKAAEIFAAAGYTPEVQTQPEPEFPDAFLTFIRVKEIEGILVMFWPTPEYVESLPPPRCSSNCRVGMPGPMTP